MVWRGVMLRNESQGRNHYLAPDYLRQQEMQGFNVFVFTSKQPQQSRSYSATISHGQMCAQCTH